MIKWSMVSLFTNSDINIELQNKKKNDNVLHLFSYSKGVTWATKTILSKFIWNFYNFTLFDMIKNMKNTNSFPFEINQFKYYIIIVITMKLKDQN